jgi:hypothetical protein
MASHPVVITGLAGSGKSMFMRYLTIKMFETEGRGVPLFVELRHINSMSKRDLLTFIRGNASADGSGVNEEQFSIGLKNGCFLIILDGFDEINIEFRPEIERQILQLRRQYPLTSLVISSRRDDRFASWVEFFIYEVQELTPDQTRKLIKTVKYDEGVKERFLKQVDDKLFQSHRSFLASPLLATIMILTYKDYAEIPSRMHVFYAQAFDTLFQKHDAYKEQYSRKFHSSLQKEDFRELLTAFCAVSYLSHINSFTEESLREISVSAIRLAFPGRSKPSNKHLPEQFVADLLESICMLQKDGIEIAFVHRSFQEYFTAKFAVKLRGEKMRQILNASCERYSDSIVTMAYDINSSLVEQDWVVPECARMVQKIKEANAEGNYGEIADAIYMQRSGGVILILIDINPSILNSLWQIYKIYGESFGKLGSILRGKKFKVQEARDVFKTTELSSPELSRDLHQLLKSRGLNAAHRSIRLPFNVCPEAFLAPLLLEEQVRDLLQSLERIRAEATTRLRGQNRILDSLLRQQV